MSKILTRDSVFEQAQLHSELPNKVRQPHQVDRTFELPTGLFAFTAAAYLGFLVVMSIGLMNPELAIPMVIFAIFILGFFGVPAVWIRMHPENKSRSLSWGRFLNEGIQINTGHMKAKDAMVQMLILPVLIFVWGVAIVAIRVFAG